MSDRVRYSIAAVAAASLLLAGCTNSEQDSDTKVDTATSAAMSAAPSSTKESAAATSGIMLKDGFIKAKPADAPMTPLFGVLHNTTDADVTLTGFSADSLTGAKFEIHEVVDGAMQQKPGGIVIPAGGTYEMKPGADHLMIMDYAQPIEAGDTVDVTLNFEDRTTVQLADVPVRTIASGQEEYGADGGVEGNSGLSEAPNPEEEHDHEHGHNH